MAWSTTVPTSGSKVLATPSIFQSNWDMMNNVLGVEHYDMKSPLSGRHQPGYTGSMFVSSSVTVTALTNPFTGALAWITDAGSAMGLVRGTAAWKSFHNDLLSTQIRILGPSSLTIAASSYGFYLSGGSEISDPLSEWNTTTGVFSACEDGYFWCTSTVVLSTTTSGSDSVTLGFSGSNINEAMAFTTDPSAYASYTFNTIVSAGSGVKIAPYAFCEPQSISTSGGSGITFCQIYRTS
jgi:hypothetical protein